MSAPIRVVLVEDNDTFRETLQLVFGLRQEIQVVGSVATGHEAPALCAELAPDVVLMDYRMPGMNGAEATRAVLAAAPATRVVCLTASVTKTEVAELLEAGAVACLTKDEDFDRIVAAVEDAAGR
ncbi:MAG TPA: response regulator transcription factor [Gaiellaceae bacterium]